MSAQLKFVSSLTKILSENQETVNQERLYFYGVKNEYESCQLIVKTDKKLQDVRLSTNDVSNDDLNVISKDSFSVYLENYSEVKGGSDFSIAFPSGKYPDLLIEQEKIKTNSSLFDCFNSIEGAYLFWVTVKIPKNCNSGTYSGVFLLQVGEEKINVPVEIEVAEHILSDKSTMYTSFGLFCDHLDPKYETDDEFIDICFEEYFKYRLNPFMHFREYPESEKIVSLIDKYFDNPKMTAFGLPDFFGAQKEKRIDKFREIILLLAEKSTDKRNLLSKIYVYFFDEPEGNNIVKETESNYDYYHNLLREVLEEIKQDNSSKYANFKKIENYEEYVLNVKSLGTILIDTYSGKIQEQTDIWCPAYAGFVDENIINQTMGICKHLGAEMWWYGCMGPKYPFPTYHLADKLYSSRIVSWMQYYYGITGNLYWRAYGNELNEINVLDNKKGECDISYKPFGDGFLFYYGSICNQKRPLPSIRLMSIRDGIEEYELLYDLEKKYKKFEKVFDSSFEAKKAVKILCSKLFNNIYVTNDLDLFNYSRREVIEKLSNKYSIPYAMGDIKICANKGKAIFFTEKNTRLFVNDVELKDNNNGVFSYEFALISKVNTIKVTLLKNDVKEERFEFLSNHIDYFDCISCDECINSFETANAESEMHVRYSPLRNNIVSKGVSIELNYNGENHPEVFFDFKSINKDLLANANKISFSVYNCESRSLTIFEKLVGDGREEYIEANELFDGRENILNVELDLLKSKIEFEIEKIKLILRNTYKKDDKKSMKIIIDNFKIFYNK